MDVILRVQTIRGKYRDSVHSGTENKKGDICDYANIPMPACEDTNLRAATMLRMLHRQHAFSKPKGEPW